MLKKFLTNYWPILGIAIVSFAFFYRLFFPLSVFINPDYGRSDLMHFNIPIRKAMSDSLKKFEIPFWEPQIGQGFPLIDEGQVGFFYLPNLIFFGLLPFWVAFNVGLLFTFCLAAFGTYLLARSFHLDRASSYLAAITYTFSPILILRLHHYNLLQSAAIFPLMLWSVNSFFNSKRIVHLGIFSLLLPQQIFAGVQQLTSYGLIGASLLFIYKTVIHFKKNSTKIKVLSIFFASMIFALLISSVQLNSTLTLINMSSRLQNQSPQKILSDFPYNPSNLLTIFNPFILGNVNNATYPRWNPSNWGLFWENNTYFGLTQLILIALLTSNLLLKKNSKLKSKANLLFLYTLFLLGILISLGKFGPFHPIFSIPPISFFRVPSRFLIFTFLSAAIIAAYSLELIKDKLKSHAGKFVISAIIILSIADIFRSWFNYPLLAKVDDLKEKPAFLKEIKPGSRIATFGQTSAWNSIFFQEGWVNQTDRYLFFTNLMDQNLNVIYQIDNIFAYAAMEPRRAGYIEGLAKQSIIEKKESIEFSSLTQNLLDLSGTEYVISTKKLVSERWELKNTISNNQTEFYLYLNKFKMPRVFAVAQYEVGNSIDKIAELISSNEFNPRNKIVLEKEPGSQFLKNNNLENKVEITSYSRNKITIAATLPQDSIVVISDSFYPGWKAKVDGSEQEILAANINSRALVIPAGKHTIEYSYTEPRFLLFFPISVISTFLLTIFLFRFKNLKIEESH